MKKNIFGFLLLLVNASALLIFIIFIILSINLKTKIQTKNILFYIFYLKFVTLHLTTDVFNKELTYYSLVDLNSNLAFSTTDLHKLGFLLYYYFFF